MKLKKSVKKVLVLILVLFLLILVASLVFVGYQKFVKKNTVGEVEIVDKIEEYGYYLEDDQPELYKDMYEQLRETLNQEQISEKDYASLVAQMIVLDFYHLDNKISKNDIGGTQFVLAKYRDNFILEASETVYKYIEHNVYQNRKQELPKVKNVEVKNVKTNRYSYDKMTDEKAYIVTVNVEYEKDLGYPKEVVVKMIHTKLTEEKTKLEVFYLK